MSLDAALEHLCAGQPQAALPLLEAHVAAHPSDAGVWFLVGACRHQLGNAAEALEAFERSLALSPDPNATYASAVALEDLGRFDDSLARYDAALSRVPGHEDALHNRGLLLARLGRLEEAERSHRRYVELHPDSLRAHRDIAEILLALSRYEEAIDELNRILARAPRDAIALLKRGVALAALRRFDESRTSIGVALAADRPAVMRFIRNLAPQAEPEVMLAPQNIFLWRRYVAQGACDWQGWQNYVDDFRRAIGNPGLPLDRALAFSALHLPLDESERHALARRIAVQIERKISPLPVRSATGHERLRIGVLSPDLREHLNAYLLLPLLELINRRHFEIFAYSLGADDGSAIRGMVNAAVDRFHDLSGRNDRDAANLIRADEIDILVDCAGHTTGSRFEITAQRPASVQALYLAYPSTIGSKRVDFAIVDRVAAPPGSEANWSEVLIYLPDTYFLYDFRAPMPRLVVSRAEYGLPDDAVVYCAGHKPEKITPDGLDLWLSVLAQVPRAVLWLNAMPTAAVENLRRESAARGISPERLIFAPFDARERYLARQRLGDLMLDAVHHSAMTTACDALGAGLPVLTLKGATFASRAGESLLRAAGLPELVAADPDAFVRIATTLGNDRALLTGLKDKLRANRQTAPLFDTVSRVRQLEAAFAEMWRRHRQA